MKNNRITACRLSVILLSLLLVFTTLLTSACGAGQKASSKKTASSHKLKIVATIFTPYDFARQIGGKDADVKMLLKPGEEAHSYEPTPKDIREIQSADLFIYVGGDNDSWVKKILQSMGNQAPKSIKLIDLTSTVTEEETEGMQENPAERNEHAKDLDEHVWTSPVKAIEITRKISKEMQKLDPKHQEDYKANTAAYVRKLSRLDRQFKHVVSHSKRKEIIFADRFPLRYLADELGLKYYAAFSGCSANTEPSARTVSFLTDKVRKDHIPVVFTIELSNHQMADSICEVTGARRMTFYSCHNVTAKQKKAGVTYLSMMEHNVKVLNCALNH
jgi:zinc transport system substrate-binding protein